MFGKTLFLKLDHMVTKVVIECINGSDYSEDKLESQIIFKCSIHIVH